MFRTRFLMLLAVALVVTAPAAARRDAQPAPTGLRAFLLRADEPIIDTFPRTPSFAWTPYAGARSYDFQLATSQIFDDSSIVWSTATRTKDLRVPAISVPVALPWMTGNPYALYARVRARTASGYTPWSQPFGFNMRWKALPERVTPDYPGLVRWRPVEGATSYEVWFLQPGKVITTITNVADLREYYTFHPTAQWTAVVSWRVRAVRKIYGTIPNGLPVVSQGPWSDVFTSANTDAVTGPIVLSSTVSDQVGTETDPKAHSLAPAFIFSGNQALDASTARLFRVYVSTDRQCVNIVFRGAIIGSPAYAPRTSGPLGLPTSTSAVTAAESSFPPDGKEAATSMSDDTAVTTSELTTESANPGGRIPAEFAVTGEALVDLWDSGWPTGRYYWTVVPVREVTSESNTVSYVDADVPQDACAAGRLFSFGKSTQPATTSTSRPYVSGLSPRGALVAARGASPRFYRAALIAWEPALGATGYEVQWSRTKYPWRAVGKPYFTAATSVLLEGLKAGRWYYRVRGIDPYIPGPVKEMAWSDPLDVVFAKPTYTIERPIVVYPRNV
jgi:hypothetical protein